VAEGKGTYWKQKSPIEISADKLFTGLFGESAASMLEQAASGDGSLFVLAAGDALSIGTAAVYLDPPERKMARAKLEGTL
jgi:hypothetical protein